MNPLREELNRRGIAVFPSEPHDLVELGNHLCEIRGDKLVRVSCGCGGDCPTEEEVRLS